MVVYYDPHYPAFLSIFVINGTVIRATLMSAEFWVHVSSHIFLSIYFFYKKTDVDLTESLIPKDAWQLTAGFLTFLIVFFSGQCYSRYLEMYQACQTIDESMKLFIRELITFLHMPSVRRQVRIATKYMLASVFIFYFSLSDGGLAQEEWDMLQRKRLLSMKEIDYIRCYAGHKGVILTSWATRAAQHAMRTEEPMKLFTPPERAALMNRIDSQAVNSGKAMRRIADLMAMPLPYAYFHLLSLLMVINFTMTNWYLASHHCTWLTIPPFVCYVLVFLGLRRLSASLADPFQPEEEDPLQVAFPCVSFLENAFSNGVNLMESLEKDKATGIVMDPQHRLEMEYKDELDDLLNFNVEDSTPIKIGGANGWQKDERSVMERVKDFSLRGTQKYVAFKWRKLDERKFLEEWVQDERMRTRSVMNPSIKPEVQSNPVEALAELGSQQQNLVALVQGKVTPEEAALLRSGDPPQRKSMSKKNKRAIENKKAQM